MTGVEQGFDAIAVTHGDQFPRALVPQHKSILAAQVMHALGTEILEQMQGNLAVGAGAQMVAAALQISLDSFIIIKLAVRDDPHGLVFVGDWLVARVQIDDAQPRMSKYERA